MRNKALPVGLVLVVLLSQIACNGPEPPVASTPMEQNATDALAEQSHIQTLLVTVNPALPVLNLSGRIAYAEDRFSLISSPLQGRVTEVRIKLGDRVKAGQILLVVDSPDIASAYSDFVKEHSDLSLAKRFYELTADLYKVQAVPLKDFKQAENDLRKAEAEFRRAKERLLSLKVPVAELEKPIEQQNIISIFKLRSPLDGTVVGRSVTPGQLVGGDPSQVLFTIADLDTLQIIADVYEKDLGLVKMGQVAAATVESSPGVSFPAVIAAIGDLVDPTTRTIKIRALVNNGGHRLKPDMFARLHIQLGGNTPFISIPNEAVVEVEGHMFVYIQDGPAHYVKRQVQVEKLSGKQMRVLEGITAGERIVSKGAVLLKGLENLS